MALKFLCFDFFVIRFVNFLEFDALQKKKVEMIRHTKRWLKNSFGRMVCEWIKLLDVAKISNFTVLNFYNFMWLWPIVRINQ